MLVATDARFDPAKALDLIERYDITAASCWPLAAEAMVTDPSFPDRNLSSLTNAPTQLRGEAWDGLLPDQRETSLGMSSDPDAVDIGGVGDAMDDRGWHLNRLVAPPGLHLMLSPAHARVVDALVADLADCVAHHERARSTDVRYS